MLRLQIRHGCARPHLSLCHYARFSRDIMATQIGACAGRLRHGAAQQADNYEEKNQRDFPSALAEHRTTYEVPVKQSRGRGSCLASEDNESFSLLRVSNRIRIMIESPNADQTDRIRSPPGSIELETCARRTERLREDTTVDAYAFFSNTDARIRFRLCFCQLRFAVFARHSVCPCEWRGGQIA